MESLQSETICVLCQKTNGVRLFFACSDEGGEGFDILRCENCQLAWTWPRPAREDLLRYYLQDYYGPRHVKFEFLTELAVGFFTRWRAWLLGRFCPPGARVLDVGCGRGNFVGLMAGAGHDVQGTELSDATAEHARGRFGDRINVGDLAELTFPENHFDLVVMWHVLEHVPDPVGNMRAVRRMLKPGGCVVVAVPNFASFQAVLGRSMWFHLDVPRHLYHFTPVSLGRLLGSAGFSVIRSSSFSVEQNPFGLLQTALNVFAGAPNLLYKTLKRGTSENFRWSLRLFWRGVYWAGLPLALLLSTLESLAGRGGTFYVVARKMD